MQSERTVEEAALSGSVRGLGVCDALRLELQPAQLPQLVEQIEALWSRLEREIRRRPVATSFADPREAEQSKCPQYELHLVERLRDGLPVGEVSAPFATIGPAGMGSPRSLHGGRPSNASCSPAASTAARPARASTICSSAPT